MILEWFDATEASKFGKSLAQALIDRTPQNEAIGNRFLTRKHEAMLHHLETEVTRFRSIHKLNVFKKAKLGNAFKWALKEKSYDSDYIDQVTNWLMHKL